MDPALRELLRDDEAAAPDRMVEAIIRFRRADVRLPGVRIVARFGRIATCRIPLGAIREVRDHPDVRSLKAARPLGPGIGSSPPAMPPAGRGSGPFPRRPAGLDLTGAGVVVGVVDWGLDVDHPNFKNPDGSTRLLALWDQRNGSTAPYGYGTVHTRDRINQALRTANPYRSLGYHCADADRGGGSHGTHVMDIAAGSGRKGSAGVAPGADLVFVHLTDGATGGLANFGDSVRLLEAVDFIARTAGERPWVINLSMGRHGGPHDGSTLTELALDELLAAGNGRFIAQSGGNYRRSRTHASGTLRQGESRVLTFVTDPADTSANELEIWYDGWDELAVRIDPPGGTGPVVRLGEDAEIKAGRRVVGRIYHRSKDPNNGDNHVDAFLYPGAPSGKWRVTIDAARVGGGTFHAWIERDDACRSCQARFVPEDSRSASTTGTIANGHLPLVVGAYDASTAPYSLAMTSSSGPTRDGRGKPDLVAPGVNVLAARSAPRGSTRSDGLLVRKSGSSMASPHVAGAVALCLQAGGHRLDARTIRRFVLATADPPGTVTLSDAARIGGGYLNIPALLATVRKVFPNKPRREESVMYADNTTPLAVVPSRAYRELIYRPDGELSRWFGERFAIVARPGEPAPGLIEGDVVLGAVLGQPGERGECAVIADRRLSRRRVSTADRPAGWYAAVTDPASSGGPRTLRILDTRGCLQPGYLLLRRQDADSASAEAEDSDGWTGSAEQIEFRERVLAEHIARSGKGGRSAKRDLLPGELTAIPDTKIQTATQTALAAGRLLKAANAALSAAQEAGDADALRTVRLTVVSGYRGSDHQRKLWRGYFAGYYNRTRKARAALPDGPHSAQAVDYLLKPRGAGGFGIGGRIAAPGFSNHQGGIAVDLLQVRTKGNDIANKSDDASRARWRDTWFHRWLVANAADHGFRPLATEEWHWEYRPTTAAAAPKHAATVQEDGSPLDHLGGKLWTFTAKALPLRVAVFCPKAALGRREVDVLVFAHGLLHGCPRPAQVPSGIVTDAPFRLGRVVDGSDRPIVLVVPLLDWSRPGGEQAFGSDRARWHALAKPAHLNAVVDEVVAEIARVQAGSSPALGELMIAGHSRAYDFLEPLAHRRGDPAMNEGALSRLTQVWSFDTTYAGQVSRWTDWLRRNPRLRVHFFYRPVGKTKAVGDTFYAERGDRLTVTQVTEGHCAVPATRLAQLLTRTASSDETLLDPDLSADLSDGEFETGNPAYEVGEADETDDGEADPLIRFTEIDGTPVYYWRSGGRPNTTTRNWRCTQAFYDRLVVWLQDLRALSSGYGTIRHLVSAGFYVDKPGQHGVGTAMDLDHVEWSNGTVSTPLDRHHASPDIAVRRRYLAVEAVCRRNFRYVLDGWYNAAHEDHIHADIEALPVLCRKKAKSDTKFVQAVCNDFADAGLTIDGRWGSKTQAAFDTAKTALGITGDPHTSSTVWQSMLASIAQRGFANQSLTADAS